MLNSWQSYLDGQEAGEFGEFLKGLISDLVYISDIPTYRYEAYKLRRQLEIDYEKGGGVVECITPAHYADHLTHVHKWSNTNISGLASLEVIHAAYHTPADEVKV